MKASIEHEPGPEAQTRVPALVARVLRDESYFGDGPPAWPGAPSSSDAKEARKRDVKRLRRFAPRFPGAEELAAILDDCQPGHRCMSGACPECGRASQRFIVAEIQKLAESGALT